MDNLFPISTSDPAPNIADGPELVFALVAAVGVDLKIAEEALKAHLKTYNYNTIFIKITKDVIPRLHKIPKYPKTASDYQRINDMMDLGNEARKKHGNDILALGAAAIIAQKRKPEKKLNPRTAYIIHSLKHPDEVRKLRELYPKGFHLIGIHAHPDFRKKHLIQFRKTTEDEAKELMDRDKKGKEKYGQRLVDTFHLADFFAGWSGDDVTQEGTQDLNISNENEEKSKYKPNSNRIIAAINRYVDIVFGHRYLTPTFGEHAMFMAFTSALRSADLSRQVGAVIAKDGEILSTGSNDCPKAKGGLYWPILNRKNHQIADTADGRDYKRGFDSNRDEQDALINEIITTLKSTPPKIENTKISPEDYKSIESNFLSRLSETLNNCGIRNLTEYGRVVHAEMEAILSCTRQGISTKGATVYCTTFPCHNCAKHIIAAGIERVVFIEPYLKSKALIFHKDSIVIHYPQDTKETTKDTIDERVKFEPFFGVGPRRYLDLFSMSLGTGTPLERKDSNGKIINWIHKDASPRLQMQHVGYLEREAEAAAAFIASSAKTKATKPKA